MLSYPRHKTAVDVDLDSIHNYYETIVLDKVSGLASDADFDHNLIPDIACVALNHLPPRYIRHDVDMAFYLSPSEYDEIEHKIDTPLPTPLPLYWSARLKKPKKKPRLAPQAQWPAKPKCKKRTTNQTLLKPKA